MFKGQPGRRKGSVVVVFDNYGVVMPVVMPGRRTHYDDGAVTMMPMPGAFAVVVERDLSVAPMMETLTVFVDDHVAVILVVVSPVMVSMAGGDDHVRLSRGSYSRHSQGKRQGAEKYRFHREFSKRRECPFVE